jgi:hypothetical protein
MCNPRRVRVTATRQVREAWEREVRRAATVSLTVGGEARIRQQLDASVGAPALMAMQLRLARGAEGGCDGWVAQPDGAYRHDVEGGYVLYHPAERQLEIVATASATLTGTGVASQTLGGTLEADIEATAEAGYYDDGWGGHTEAAARREAEQAAARNADAGARQRLDAAADAAEQAADPALTAAAAADARRRLEARAELHRAELEQRAREHLAEVGIRARQAFHRLLALGYRDALEGLARRRGVAPGDIDTRETDDYLEIDLLLPD